MNSQLRKMIRDAGLKHWQIADMCGISEATLVRWLRHELTREQKEQIQKAIKEAKNHVGFH